MGTQANKVSLPKGLYSYSGDLMEVVCLFQVLRRENGAVGKDSPFNSGALGLIPGLPFNSSVLWAVH